MAARKKRRSRSLRRSRKRTSGHRRKRSKSRRKLRSKRKKSKSRKRSKRKRKGKKTVIVGGTKPSGPNFTRYYTKIVYYPDGSKEVMQMKNNVKHGTSVKINQFGAVKSSSTYTDGKKDSL